MKLKYSSKTFCRQVVAWFCLREYALLYCHGRHSRVSVCPVPYVRNTGPSRLQDIHLCLENNPCPDCHGHACYNHQMQKI